MAYLVTHSGSKDFAENSFVMNSAERAADLAFRLNHNGAVGVFVRELTAEEYRAEKAKRLPPHLQHLAS